MLKYFIKTKYPSLTNMGFAVEYYDHYSVANTTCHGIDTVLLSYIDRGEGKH